MKDRNKIEAYVAVCHQCYDRKEKKIVFYLKIGQEIRKLWTFQLELCGLVIIHDWADIIQNKTLIGSLVT